MWDSVEQRIIKAIRGLLTGRVNELLGELQFHIPLIEFGDYCGGSVIVPVITLASCERTEKERIILMDAYSLTITFTLPETPESELHCYAYSAVVCKALEENPTLNGIADRVGITGKKYVQPKKVGCGEGRQITISLRVTVESMRNEE